MAEDVPPGEIRVARAFSLKAVGVCVSVMRTVLLEGLSGSV